MTEYIITKSFSNIGTRNEVRMRLVEELSKEVPGNGRDEEASRYTYYVEKLLDGRRIFLRRPANLHNGFDFLVCVENTNFSEAGKRKRNFPKHDEIVNDLLIFWIYIGFVFTNARAFWYWSVKKFFNFSSSTSLFKTRLSSTLV